MLEILYNHAVLNRGDWLWKVANIKDKTKGATVYVENIVHRQDNKKHIQRFRVRGQHVCLFIRTKESF